MSKNTEISFSLRNPCNYSCEYCIGKGVHNSIIQHDMKKLYDIYELTGSFVFTVFECGTGEPTLHPQIKDILFLMKNYGTISMPTNNSISPKNWLLKDFAKSMLLNITIHPQAEKEIDSFTERLVEIRELGSVINLRYIARPDRMHNIQRLKDYFEIRGFDIKGIPFEGSYNGKEYPISYSEDEKKILKIDDNKNYFLDKKMLYDKFKTL